MGKSFNKKCTKYYSARNNMEKTEVAHDIFC